MAVEAGPEQSPSYASLPGAPAVSGGLGLQGGLLWACFGQSHATCMSRIPVGYTTFCDTELLLPLPQKRPESPTFFSYERTCASLTMTNLACGNLVVLPLYAMSQKLQALYRESPVRYPHLESQVSQDPLHNPCTAKP